MAAVPRRPVIEPSARMSDTPASPAPQVPPVETIRSVVVVGGGPAGLAAAEVLLGAGLVVDLFDAMPSVGRKFLLAGKGGLNLTHAEPADAFLGRYGSQADRLAPAIAAFGALAIVDWARGLGIDTFVGSSQRVFPAGMKAAPLLRAWLHRLRAGGLRLHTRHRWLGWDTDSALRLAGPAGERRLRPAATVLATGGASWARLGSDGTWVPWLVERGIAVTPLAPANCGFDCDWSGHLSARFAGAPVKPVVAWVRDAQGESASRQGEFVVTATGVEGSLVYTQSARIRAALARGDARVDWVMDLVPGRSVERLQAELERPRAGRSMANHLRARAGIEGVKAALLREVLDPATFESPARLAGAIKALPVPLRRPRPIDEAISTAGGVPFDALDERLMLRGLPGTFCAGEMLDWEAPTGGYLLTACLATGRAAGEGVRAWLAER